MWKIYIYFFKVRIKQVLITTASFYQVQNKRASLVIAVLSDLISDLISFSESSTSCWNTINYEVMWRLSVRDHLWFSSTFCISWDLLLRFCIKTTPFGWQSNLMSPNQSLIRWCFSDEITFVPQGWHVFHPIIVFTYYDCEVCELLLAHIFESEARLIDFCKAVTLNSKEMSWMNEWKCEMFSTSLWPS